MFADGAEATGGWVGGGREGMGRERGETMV